MDEMKGESCLILWDLHIEEEFQRRGLGKHMLTILELVAMREGMSRVYIPVQLEDDVTQAWVDKVCLPRGYAPDQSLVSLLDFDAEMEGFQVYCKEMKALPKKAPVVAAAPATVFTGVDVSNVAPATVAADAAKPAAAAAEAPDQEEEEEEEAALVLGDAIEKLRVLYIERNSREPSAEELAQWEQVLTEEAEAEAEEPNPEA